MDIACDKSYIVYHIRNPDKLTLLDFNIVVAINLIQWHQGWQRLFHQQDQIKGRSSQALPIATVAIYLSFKRPEKDLFILAEKQNILNMHGLEAPLYL